MKPRIFKSRDGLEAFAKANPGRALHVVVLHGANCVPSRCTCSPWYEVRDLTAEAVLDGADREARWKKESAS